MIAGLVSIGAAGVWQYVVADRKTKGNTRGPTGKENGWNNEYGISMRGVRRLECCWAAFSFGGLCGTVG